MSRLRLATIGFSHETNTFSNVPTDYARFEELGVFRGVEVAREFGGSQATIAGFLAADEQLDVEVVPLFFAHAHPFGTITGEAFERISAEMLDLLRANAPWDGVLLALHGAAVSENHPDADGEILRRVRELVGPAVPIGVTYDMHANVSQGMVEQATVTTVYQTNPHLDARERAIECANLIIRTVRGEIRPVQALEMPPLLVNILKQFTGEEPMRGLVEAAQVVRARAGILSTSVVEGYPYADVAEMGMSFLAVADGDPAAARTAARSLADSAWQRRADLQGQAPSPAMALRRAAAAPRGPVVLMDVGDNIGGGSPADSTILLAEARRLGLPSLLQTLCDPQAVQACVRAGVGAQVTLAVGAKTDDRHGQPITVSGSVRIISDGRFEDPRPTHGGYRFFDGGPTVRLDTTEGYTLVLTSKRVGNTSIQQMYSLGIRPEEYQVVVAKGVISPRPAYGPIASEVILVDTPGVTAADLTTFRYQRRRRPLYPFESETTYVTAR
ncbi:MAG: M81 family metallopeptidase [Chloroflexi bacterium]|nr:M81 family metallopeptidase [Chloroflexota bacterium]